MRSKYWCLVLGIVVVMVLELLADLRPFPGISWTHKQAHSYGGLAFIVLAIWVYLWPGD